MRVDVAGCVCLRASSTGRCARPVLQTAAPRAAQSGLTLSKTLWTVNGAHVDPGRVAQGERVIIQVSGSNRQASTLMLVVDDPLPAGFEMVGRVHSG